MNLYADNISIYKSSLRKIILLFFIWVISVDTVLSFDITRFSPQAVLYSDSVLNTMETEEMISQLFVADVRADNSTNQIIKSKYLPAFILGSSMIQTQYLPQNAALLTPVIIPDVSSGFETGIYALPFPDEESFSFMESENQKALMPYLFNWMIKNRYKALFYNGKYLYNKSDAINECQYIILPEYKNDNSLIDADILTIHKLPNSIIRNLPSFIIQDFSKNKDLWRVSSPYFITQKTDREISVEQLLKEGNIFITNNYHEDFTRILLAIKNRLINIESLRKTCKYILAYKYEIYHRTVATSNAISPKMFEAELYKGYKNSIEVYQTKEESPLPLVFLNINIGFLSDGDGYFEDFRNSTSKYITTNSVSVDPQLYDVVFWLVGPDYKFEDPVDKRIFDIKSRFSNASLIMVRAGNLSELPFKNLPSGLDALIVSPANLPVSWSAMAQAAFNGIAVNKKKFNTLVSDSLSLCARSFISTRLKYGIPEEVGLNSDTLLLIDDIVEDAIRKSATPGAQVLVAKNGVVIFNKNYGFTDYEKKYPVTNDIIYDLASVTKIMATLPVLMQQYDNGRWRLNNKLSDFIPQANTTNKRDITIRQLLLHESGFQSVILFNMEAIDRTKLIGNLYSNRRSSSHPIRIDETLYMNKTVTYRDDIFRSHPDLDFSVPVANNLFMNIFHLDSMLFRMLNAKINPTPRYRYSDINFIILQKISENLAQESLDKIVINQFYNKIGATSLCFNPWRGYPINKIAPTENDKSFRRQLIQGYVHDPAAAMMGGVAGHAGLFGNSNDLAKMLQMYLNKGSYGGYRYIQEGTIDFFTSQQDSLNRRGLGFDKPDIGSNINSSSVSYYASPLSYGHTGFTGTIVWVDPAYDLIYIFLSNRIHPYSYNKKLMNLNIRPLIHNVIYRSFNPEIKFRNNTKD